MNNQCNTWDSNSGACTSCYNGYVISRSNCVVGSGGQQPPMNPSAGSIPNCAQVSADGRYCVQCNYRFFLYNGVCQSVSEQCNTWDVNTGGCTSCFNGYVLSGSNCVIGNGGQQPPGSISQCNYRFFFYNGAVSYTHLDVYKRQT